MLVPSPIPLAARFNPDQIDGALANIRTNLRHYRQLKKCERRSEPFVLVGGGPSLDADAIRQAGGKRFALNHAVQWLAERDLTPHGSVIMEVRPWPTPPAPVPGVTYYLASCTDPGNYEALGSNPIVQWHAWDEIGEEAIVKARYPKAIMVGGGATASCRAIPLGLWLGYRRFEAFGLDSSFEGQAHAYKHDEENQYQDARIEVELGGRTFTTTPVLWRQARDMIEFLAAWPQVRIRFHGEGLLPFAHRLYFKEAYDA